MATAPIPELSINQEPADQQLNFISVPANIDVGEDYSNQMLGHDPSKPRYNSFGIAHIYVYTYMMYLHVYGVVHLYPYEIPHQILAFFLSLSLPLPPPINVIQHLSI